MRSVMPLINEYTDTDTGTFVGPVVTKNCVKFGDFCLNRSREIPPEAVIFYVFLL